MSVIRFCFLPGTLLRPILWAEPSPVVPQGSSVTLWCQGTPGTKKIQVIREGSSLPWKEGSSLPENKLRISISAMTKFNTGTYHCSSQNWEDRLVYSEPLELVVTGETHPGPRCYPGGRICLQKGVTLTPLFPPRPLPQTIPLSPAKL